MRASGVLLPISSLPSDYGIGTFSKEAYKFVEQLQEAGQKYWQILPLGPTGYGDSPYQSFSTFAGNPYYIDLEALSNEGLLTREELAACDFGDNEKYIDYEKIYFARFDILRKAYERSNIRENQAFKEFKEKNSFWLDDYALYMAVKNKFEGKAWIEWDMDIRMRENKAIKRYRQELEDEIIFYEFQQYTFARQWKYLKDYANERGIKIIGDIPIYVAFDGADSWSNPKLFQFDEECKPIAVAGCPPDAFSATGQLWGNPLYDWDYHKRTGYKWWVQRVAYCFELYDVVRIDHFRGFDEYYSIPYGETTAVNGKWMPGPGYSLFDKLNNKLGKVDIIAEDLGFLTDTVLELLEKTGYPGMKILQFAFDSREDSDYLPHNYTKNSIVYTGTHDNDTICGWYNSIPQEDKDFAAEYMNMRQVDPNGIQWDFIRLGMASVSDTCIIPLQDYLGVASEARVNVPSTLGTNWKWRMSKDEVTPDLVQKIKAMTKLYARLNEDKDKDKDKE